MYFCSLPVCALFFVLFFKCRERPHVYVWVRVQFYEHIFVYKYARLLHGIMYKRTRVFKQTVLNINLIVAIYHLIDVSFLETRHMYRNINKTEEFDQGLTVKRFAPSCSSYLKGLGSWCLNKNTLSFNVSLLSFFGSTLFYACTG